MGPLFACSHSTAATAAPLSPRTQYSLQRTPALRLVPTSDLEALCGAGRARVRTAEEASARRISRRSRRLAYGWVQGELAIVPVSTISNAWQLGPQPRSGYFPAYRVEIANESELPPMANKRCENYSVQRAGRCQRSDARHAPARGRDHESNRYDETVGRHRHHRGQRKDGSASPRGSGKCDLCSQRPCPHAVG